MSISAGFDLEVELVYVTPAGRDLYKKNITIGFNEIEDFISFGEKLIQEQKYQKEIEAQKKRDKIELEELLKKNEAILNVITKEKEKVKEKRKETERKEKVLLAFQRELLKQEEALKKEKQEFINATKENMYSVGGADKKEPYVRQRSFWEGSDNEEKGSVYLRLKILKEKLEQGEISYQEYSKRRKELE